MNEAEQRQRVVRARVARLATVDAEGRPHLVPVTFVLIGDTAYFAVDHKPKQGRPLRRVSNIETTGRACLLVDEYDDDWSRLWWIRLDGLGRIVADPAERDRAIAALVEKYHRHYRGRPPGEPVVAIDITKWSTWSPAG